MKRSLVIAASALLGVVSLTGCSNDTTNSGGDTSTSTATDTTTEVGSNAVEASIMDSLDNTPDWLVIEEGGALVENEHGYKSYRGNIYCPASEENPDVSYPVYLDETAMVEPTEDGDLIYSFLDGYVPPGLLLPFYDGWLVAIFEDSTVTEYRIRSEVADPDHMVKYATNPTFVRTCW